MNNKSHFHIQKWLPWYGFIAIIFGLTLFYFVGLNPFYALFRVSLALIFGGIILFGFGVGFRLIGVRGRIGKIFGIIDVSIFLIATIVIILSLIDYRIFFFRNLSSDAWIEDTRYLVDRITNVHPNPFTKVSREDFYSKVLDLEHRIPSLSNEKITVELGKLVGMIGDGHTQFLSLFPPTRFQLYPLSIAEFNDGFYVIDAAPKYKHLNGMRLVKVEDTTIEDAREKVNLVAGVENGMNPWVKYYLLSPEVLHSLGLIENRSSTEFTLETNTGEHITEKITPISELVGMYWEFKPLKGWLYESDVLDTEPLYLSRSDENFWFEFLNASKILYVRFHRVLNNPNETISDFSNRIEHFINENNPDRMIIDLRGNDGGNNMLFRNFIDMLSRNQIINQRGNLFTIIDGGTFSAGVNFVSSLENKTKTIFVGQPTGAGPNHYGDNQTFILPNSKIRFFISTRVHQYSDPFDSRQWHAPDIPVKLSYTEYITQKDPSLAAIINYSHDPDPLQLVTINKNEWQKYVGRYYVDTERVTTVQLSDDNTLILHTDLISSDLYPISNKEFSTDISNMSLNFSDPQEGKFQQLKIKTVGYERIMQRAPSGYRTLLEMLRGGDYSEAVSGYRILFEMELSHPSVSEQRLNQLGYQLINENNFLAAIAIFKLNVDLYPNSWNVYDSLGEAFKLNGDKRLAITNYRKSLEINPNNKNVIKILSTLE